MVRTRLAALAAGAAAAASLLVAAPASAAQGIPGDAVCATHQDDTGRYVYLRSDLPQYLRDALDAGKAPNVPKVKAGVSGDYTLTFWPGSGYVKDVKWTYTWTQVDGFGTSGNGTPVYSVTRSVSDSRYSGFHESGNSDFYWWAPRVCGLAFVQHHFHGTLDGARAAGFPA